MTHQHKRVTHVSTVAAMLSTAVMAVCSLASAQTLPRSFVASPDNYKVVAENQDYRVVAVTWKPGQRDKLHSHPASAVYYLTDCSLRVFSQDMATLDINRPTGYAAIQASIPGHSIENIGKADCKLIMFEPQ